MRRSAPSTTELRIAAGLRRRDPDAVRALYAEYGPGALALLHDAIRDRGAVEDVYQQVLLEAWQRGRSFDPARASLRTWLATIARSRAIDHLRRRVPEPYDPSGTYADGRELGGASSEPVAQLVDRVTLEQLLERLTPEESEVVRLRWQRRPQPAADRRAHGRPARDGQVAHRERAAAPAGDAGGGAHAALSEAGTRQAAAPAAVRVRRSGVREVLRVRWA